MALPWTEHDCAALLGAMAEAMAVVDLASERVLDVTPALCRLLDRSAEELERASVRELFAPAADADVARLLAEIATRGRRQDVSLSCIRPDGTGIAAEVSAARFVAGSEPRAVVVIRDVTERTRRETALRTKADALARANEELAYASRAKDDFLAIMSHELRTPLNAILGLTEALEEEVYGALDERQLRTIRRIGESGRHLHSLISDILDLTTIATGNAAVARAPVPIDALCRASVEAIQEAARHKRLSISLRLTGSSSAVVGDDRRLEKVLVSLLDNAVKFTPEGGSIGLDASVDASTATARLAVWDTGIGISDDDREHLFRPFVQLDSSLARKHTGTGLGLALVRKVIDLLGGSVELESEPGEGSRFTVVLRLWSASTPPSSAPAPSA